jgi:hypothetical protein
MATYTLSPTQSEGDISLPTDADLSALQYHFVKCDATDNKVVACGALEKPLGILQNAPDGSSSDATACVRVYGISKLKLDEAVVHGNFLVCTATSKGEVADAANEEYGAVAIGSGADGDLLDVLIQRGEVTASDA